MGKLYDRIRRLIQDERYVVGQHASERLEERGILEWQVIAGMSEAELPKERPQSQPNPAAELQISLPDGTECNVVWALLPKSRAAKLVTVHFFDEEWS